MTHFGFDGGYISQVAEVTIIGSPQSFPGEVVLWPRKLHCVPQLFLKFALGINIANKLIEIVWRNLHEGVQRKW